MKKQAQISIIGLGQIGASVGMALSPQGKQFHRVGYDAEMSIAKAAQRNDAVDEVKFRLEAAVKDADVLFLALPFHEMRKMMETIAPMLRKRALIMETAPVKKIIRQWVEELFPERYAYVGLTPAINASYLHETRVGWKTASSDLFENGIVFLSAPPSTPPDAVQFAASFVEALGAQPLFSEEAEVDGLMASVHLLPQLSAAALVHATFSQPGVRDSQKLAGKAYAKATAPLVHQDVIPALEKEALLDKENALRSLDALIASLQHLRDDIAQSDSEALSQRLLDAVDKREHWWGERLEGKWGAPERKGALPEMPRLMDRLFGISPRTHKK